MQKKNGSGIAVILWKRKVGVEEVAAEGEPRDDRATEEEGGLRRSRHLLRDAGALETEEDLRL